MLIRLFSYDDGSIRIWDSRLATVVMRFNGHRSAITTLAFDKDCVRLASGAKDTDIIVWDLVAEVGLFKLRGHKDQITGLRYLNPLEQKSTLDSETNSGGQQVNGQSGDDENHAGYLLSTSKDALIKRFVHFGIIFPSSIQFRMLRHITGVKYSCWLLEHVLQLKEHTRNGKLTLYLCPAGILDPSIA